MGKGSAWGALPGSQESLADRFRRNCGSRDGGVWPYFVGDRGFMTTPPIDVCEKEMSMIGDRLIGAMSAAAGQEPSRRGKGGTRGTEAETQEIEHTITGKSKQAWRRWSTGPDKVRFSGPPVEEMSAKQRDLYDRIRKARTTGFAGPFGPWLANPAICDSAVPGKIVRYETSMYSQRQREIIILPLSPPPIRYGIFHSFGGGARSRADRRGSGGHCRRRGRSCPYGA